MGTLATEPDNTVLSHEGALAHPSATPKMLEDDPKFRRTAHEIIVDHAEDTLRQEIGVIIQSIQTVTNDAIALIRVKTEEAVMAIHEAKFDAG